MYINQKTIKSSVSFSGVGLHNGEEVKIKLSPEKINTGIYFQVNGYKEKIFASWKNAYLAPLCTKIKKNNAMLSTIEHLMSALSGLGITNLKISTSNSEIPIMDGSAKEFVEKIISIGIQDQIEKNSYLKIKKKIEVRNQHKLISIEPTNNNDFEVDLTLDFSDDLIKKQNLKYLHTPDNYLNIYKARTFCFQKDLEKIFSIGLAKGGSLENAIVISGTKILNQGGLRYQNEFVKHKILDCIGDLYLAGYPIIGKVKSYQGGHEMNLLLLKEIFKDKNNYQIIKVSDALTASKTIPLNKQIIDKSIFVK